MLYVINIPPHGIWGALIQEDKQNTWKYKWKLYILYDEHLLMQQIQKDTEFKNYCVNLKGHASTKTGISVNFDNS